MMEKYNMGWHDLMEMPYERYLELRRIMSLEQKKEAEKNEQMEKKAKRARKRV